MSTTMLCSELYQMYVVSVYMYIFMWMNVLFYKACEEDTK